MHCAGIGLLRYYAGDLSEAANQDIVYTAIVDLWANKVVSIEPYSWGPNAAKWTWQAFSVVVTDPDGNPNEIKLRKPKREPVARDEPGFFGSRDSGADQGAWPSRWWRRRRLFNGSSARPASAAGTSPP